MKFWRSVTVGLVIAISGCSGQPSGGREEAPATPASRATLEIPSETVAVPWKTLRTTSFGPGAVNEEVNSNYVAYWSDFDATGRDHPLKVYDNDGRKVLQRPSPSGPAFVQAVWLTESYVVIEEIDDPAREVRIVAYDLTTGRQLKLPGPEPTQPEIDASFGRIEYTSGSSGTRLCQQIVELASLTLKQGACARRGQVVGDIAVGPTSSTFSIVTDPDSPRRCKQVVLETNEAVSVPPHQDRCLPWSGAVGAAGFAWDEMDPGQPDLGEAQGYVLIGGQPQRLGNLTTDSIVACGDSFYWTATDRRGTRIDRLADVDGHRTVLGPDVEDQGVYGLECTDGRWLHAMVVTEDRGKSSSRYIVLDTEAT